jgi:hypothetical protein
MENKTNEHGINFSLISVGDRVEVTGCMYDNNERHWGKVRTVKDLYLYMDMDDKTLDNAFAHDGDGKGGGFLAYEEEIVGHMPLAGASGSFEGEPTSCTEETPAPDALKEIQATIDYLELITARKWEAMVDGVSLGIAGHDSYGGEMTIKFVEKKESK